MMPKYYSLPGEEMDVPVDQIILDDDVQSRAATDPDTVKKYAAMMKDGVVFERVSLYQSDDGYYIGDGNHRVAAAIKAKLETIPAKVRPGTKEDAMWESFSANALHGLPLNNEDKHRIVMKILLSERGQNMKDRQIADYVGAVSQPFVAARRKVLNLVMQDDPNPLTDDEIIDRRGSYKMITGDMIQSVRALANRPEPLLRKFGIGTAVRFASNEGHGANTYGRLHLGIVSNHRDGQLIVRSWEYYRGDTFMERAVQPDRARLADDADYLKVWHYDRKTSDDDLIFIFYNGHYLIYNHSVSQEIREYAYQVRVGRDTVSITRCGQTYIDWLQETQKPYQVIDLMDLPERIRVIFDQMKERSKKICRGPMSHDYKIGDKVLWRSYFSGPEREHIIVEMDEFIAKVKEPESNFIRSALIRELKPVEPIDEEPQTDNGYQPDNADLPATGDETDNGYQPQIGDVVTTRTGRTGTVEDVVGRLVTVDDGNTKRQHKANDLQPHKEEADDETEIGRVNGIWARVRDFAEGYDVPNYHLTSDIDELITWLEGMREVAQIAPPSSDSKTA